MKDNFRMYGLLALGLMLLGYSIVELRTIWTFKSDLLAINGTLRSSEIFTTTIANQDRYGHSHPSQKVELVFFLNEHPFAFSLIENVGNDFSSKVLTKIKTDIKKSKSLVIWIKKNEIDEVAPMVFQIDGDRSTILEFESVKDEKRLPAAAFLISGLGLIVLFFWLKYPQKFKKAFE